MNISLTLPQKNMYETEKFYDKTSMCNVGGCIFFHESVDVDKLKKAINKLIENSDGLRIKIHENPENITQEFFEYKYENIGYEKLSKDNYKIVLEKWMQNLFDLSDKLYEFKILDVDGRIGVFTKMHHLICDAWSATLVASKIAEYYQKFVNGEEIANDIYSYEKFVQRDGEYIESSKYEKDREFWNAKYENKPTFVSMSLDKKADLDVRAGRCSYNVPVKETEAIRKYCEENMISIAVLLEAVISLYASRINNADDITLCSLVINRSGNEEKNTIGMFNNILPLTVKVDYEQNFADFCKLISDEHYSMFRHQKYPLQNILDFVHENYGQDTQLYDIMVSYQNAQMTSEAETEWIFNGTSDLGFMMNISDRDDNGVLSFDFDYRLNCFNQETIEKIYYRLINIVNQVIVNQEIKLKDIDIVTPYEREQILVNFNDTLKEYPRNKCLHEFLEENALNMPDKVALKFEGKEMTFSEFNTKVNQLADYIISRVDKRNAIIGVMLERSFDMMIAI